MPLFGKIVVIRRDGVDGAHFPLTTGTCIFGRAFVCVMIGVSIVWIPIIQGMQGGQLYIYIQAISAYLAPPIAAVYLMAILWKRGNEKGAFWGLMIGLVVGVVRMILDFAYREPECGQPDTRPAIIASLHYMYFAVLLFLLTGVIMTVISFLTKPPTDDQIIRTTFWTRFNSQLRDDEKHDGYANGDFVSISKEIGAVEEAAEETGDAKITPYEIPMDNCNTHVEVISADGHAMSPGYVKISQTGGSFPNDDKEDGNTDSSLTASANTPQKRSLLNRGMEWFCGLTDETQSPSRTLREFTEHMRKVTSLRQDPRARMGIGIGMIILFAVDIFLYTFFSTGSDFGLLRSSHYEKFIYENYTVS